MAEQWLSSGRGQRAGAGIAAWFMPRRIRVLQPLKNGSVYAARICPLRIARIAAKSRGGLKAPSFSVWAKSSSFRTLLNGIRATFVKGLEIES
jgi:hypothetical protein